MSRLTFKELHWLMSFARKNDFFQSLLEFYRKRGYLSHKQSYYLELEIKKAKSRGKVMLSEEEFEFLIKSSEIYDALKKLLEIYAENCGLDYNIYNHLIEVKKLINTTNTLPDDVTIDSHLNLHDIPRKLDSIPLSKAKADDKLKEKFKIIQEKGRKLREQYQKEINEPKIKQKAIVDSEKKSQKVKLRTEKEPKPEKVKIVKKKPYKEVKESYIYKKKGEYIKIFTQSYTLKASIPISSFQDKNGGLLKCDCGMAFFSRRDLVKHIVRESKCLDHYISFDLEESGKEIDEKPPSKVRRLDKTKPQKAKYIYIDGQNFKLDECNFVIDGANVARECNHGSNGGRISNFYKLFEKLHSFQIENYTILCDRSLYYTIDDKNDYEKLIDKGQILETPGGTEADHFILKIAKEKDAFIISNDLFREFEAIYGRQWIRKKRISFKIINDTLFFDKIYTSV